MSLIRARATILRQQNPHLTRVQAEKLAAGQINAEIRAARLTMSTSKPKTSTKTLFTVALSVTLLAVVLLRIGVIYDRKADLLDADPMSYGGDWATREKAGLYEASGVLAGFFAVCFGLALLLRFDAKRLCFEVKRDFGRARRMASRIAYPLLASLLVLGVWVIVLQNAGCIPRMPKKKAAPTPPTSAITPRYTTAAEREKALEREQAAQEQRLQELAVRERALQKQRLQEQALESARIEAFVREDVLHEQSLQREHTLQREPFILSSPADRQPLR